MKFKSNTTVIFNSFAQTVFDQVDAVYHQIQGTQGMLTSGIEGAHGPNSLHYRGLAWDFRLPIDKGNNNKVVDLLRIALSHPTIHDVLLEGDHIHVEWDPKKS